MTHDLAGRTAIVTGAAQGIGRAVAARLADAGADVVIADVQADLADETAAELDAGAEAAVVARKCDVTDIDVVQWVVDETVEAFGGVDVLVNNAGVGGHGDFPGDVGPAEWHRVVDVNLNGTYNAAYAAAPVMIEAGYGRIVNVSSIAGRNISYHGAANYTASKWGVIGLTKHLAWDLAEHGITVNALCPGVVRTPLTEEQSEAARRRTAEKIPLGRWSEPAEQAEAVLFLASEAASYVTGSVLDVEGGISLGPRHEL